MGIEDEAARAASETVGKVAADVAAATSVASHSPDEGKRVKALMFISNHPLPTSLAAVLSCSAHSREAVRAAAVEALERFPGDPPTEALISLLADRSEWVSRASFASLLKRRSPAALGALADYVSKLRNRLGMTERGPALKELCSAIPSWLDAPQSRRLLADLLLSSNESEASLACAHVTPEWFASPEGRAIRTALINKGLSGAGARHYRELLDRIDPQWRRSTEVTRQVEASHKVVRPGAPTNNAVYDAIWLLDEFEANWRLSRPDLKALFADELERVSKTTALRAAQALRAIGDADAVDALIGCIAKRVEYSELTAIAFETLNRLEHGWRTRPAARRAITDLVRNLVWSKDSELRRQIVETLAVIEPEWTLSSEAHAAAALCLTNLSYSNEKLAALETLFKIDPEPTLGVLVLGAASEQGRWRTQLTLYSIDLQLTGLYGLALRLLAPN